jgi:hypothetical protein
MPLFRFRPRAPAASTDPLASAKSAAAWFRSLSAVDTIGRGQIVTRALSKMCRAGDLAFELVAVVEYLDGELAGDGRRLVAQYVEHSARAPALANRIWQSAYEASQGFIAAYRALLERAFAASPEPRWRQAIPRILGRLVHHHGVDAKLRVLRNEHWIPAKWIELHRLYQHACDLGVARFALAPATEGDSRSDTTIEREYIAVLLINLLNTGTLSPAEIEWAATQLGLWTAKLELEERPRTADGFVVDVGGRSGLVRRAPGESGARLRYLDTAPLTAELDRGVVALRRAAVTQAEAQRTAELERIATLERLRPAVCPEAPVIVPREPRIDVSVNVQVRVGLAAICRELEPGEAGNAAIEWAGSDTANAEREVLGSAEIAIVPRSGTPRNEPLWRVENRSASGLRIVAAATRSEGLTLGMLVAVREPTENAWVLGVVRRLNRRTSEHVEAGVAIVGTRMLAIALHAKRQARDDMGFVVDGVDVSTIGGRFDGLYLPPPSRPQRPLNVKTLLVPTREYGEGREVILIASQHVYTVALREAVEQHPEWTWAVMEIVGREARD